MDLDSIYLKLDKIGDTISDLRESTAKMEVHVARNSDDLATHIERTRLLEEKVSLLKEDVLGQRKVFTIASWVLGLLATVTSIVMAFNSFNSP